MRHVSSAQKSIRLNISQLPAGDEASDRAAPFFGLAPFVWPLAVAIMFTRAAASAWGLALSNNSRNGLQGREPEWATPNAVALELPTMRLRDFSSKSNKDRATLVCAPFALHDANIADLAPGHSLVETLQKAGRRRVFVTDWRSATIEMRDFSIDTYLADLNVAVDELKPPIDLIGLCQGGWLALVYAARFPEKVRRLVLAGAPIDIFGGSSPLSRLAACTPSAVFEGLVRSGGGRALGQHMLEMWGPALATNDQADQVLQMAADIDPIDSRALEARFHHWYAQTVDLPGTFYLEVVHRLFKENQIANALFVALGSRIDLAEVRVPMFLLAARDDELVSVDQLFAIVDLVGTSDTCIEKAIEPCGHLSLFLGAKTLEGSWQRIASWLGRDLALAKAS